MDTTALSRTAAAAEISLLVCCAAIAMFLPPLNERVVDLPVLLVGLGIAVTASLVLHLVFVSQLARLLGRSARLWPLLALVTLPIGSIVGLVLLEWQLRHGTLRPAAGTASQA